MINDLISRSALLADIGDTVVISARNKNSSELRGAAKVTDRIAAAPAVDAVPVVRCGECSKRHTLQCALYVGQYSEDDESMKMVFVTKPDDFWCADGERRKNDT